MEVRTLTMTRDDADLAGAPWDGSDGVPLTVLGKELVADGVARLTLGRPGTAVPPWRPGAHVDLVLAGDLVRQYSLCGDPSDRRSLTVAVLREADSRGGSRWIHEAVAEGAEIVVRGP